MAPVNVIVSGLPQHSVLCLKLGDVLSGLCLNQIEHAIYYSTSMPYGSLFLRAGSRLLLGPSDIVSPPGAHTAFLSAGLRRALPGGKGGFGAQLRGRASKTTTNTGNIDACRDLNGRRIGAVRRERAAAAVAAAAAGATAAAEHSGRERERKRRDTGDAATSSSFPPSPSATMPSTTGPPKRDYSSDCDHDHPERETSSDPAKRRRVVVARHAQQASDCLSDAVRQGLLRPCGTKRASPAKVVAAGDGDGEKRIEKRHRPDSTTTDLPTPLSLLQAYASSSSSSCASSDDGQTEKEGVNEDTDMSDV